MPTLPGSRGSSWRAFPPSVSWMVTLRTRALSRRGSRRDGLPTSRSRRGTGRRLGRYPAVAVAEGVALEDHRSRRIEDAFAGLPDRYLGADPGFSATYRVELEDVRRSWIVELSAERCEVFDRARGEVNATI